jgi:predicted transcriptional regulator
MKVKNVKINIQSTRGFLQEAEGVMKRLAGGEPLKKQTGIYCENLEAMRRVLTEKRLAILHTIRERRPASVYALAKILGRDVKNVTQDLEYLKALDLVELKKIKKGREKTVPSVQYDTIHLEIAV